jgi:YHS domain-containing protein
MELQMKRLMFSPNSIRRTVVVLVLAVSAAGASAGEYFEKNGIALRGYDPVAYFKSGQPVRGTAAYTAEYRGSTFQFASQANRDAFVADPARYAPQYGGFCAFGAAGGYKAAIDPTAFSVVRSDQGHRVAPGWIPVRVSILHKRGRGSHGSP